MSVVADESLSCPENEVRFKKFAEFACVRAGADLSLEFALPNTNQPIGVSTICSFREDPACFLPHFSRVSIRAAFACRHYFV